MKGRSTALWRICLATMRLYGMSTLRSLKLDDVDWRLLSELQEAGVIAGYTARVDPTRAGQPLLAFVQLRCRAGNCLLRTTNSDDFPEVVEVHKLSGEFCTLLKTRASSLSHMEGLFERLGELGELRTHIVMSTQFDGRPVQEVTPERPVTPSDGWASQR